MGIGGWQLVLILVIVFVVFGAGKLPRVMGEIGRGVKNLKDGLKGEAEAEEEAVLVKRVKKTDAAGIEAGRVIDVEPAEAPKSAVKKKPAAKKAPAKTKTAAKKKTTAKKA